MLFDKEVFVVIAHNMLLLCIYFALGAACGLFKRMLKQQRPHGLRFVRSFNGKDVAFLPSLRTPSQAPWHCRAMILNLVIGA